MGLTNEVMKLLIIRVVHAFVHTFDIGFSLMKESFQKLLGLEEVIFATTDEVALVAKRICVKFFSLTGSSIGLRKNNRVK